MLKPENALDLDNLLEQFETRVLGVKVTHALMASQIAAIKELQAIISDKEIPAVSRIKAADILLSIPSPGIPSRYPEGFIYTEETT